MPQPPIRVLIAEDLPAPRRALADLLDGAADIDLVGQAADGLEAVRLVKIRKPDVALLDIKMPRLDGIEAARLIATESPATRVVMLTTFDTDDLIFQAILAGAIGYLLKGAADEEILTTVRDAARGQTRLSPGVARRVLDDFRRIKRPPTTSDADPFAEPLTERESAVLDLIGAGKSNREIGQTLGLAEGTVKNHVSAILSKLHARSRTELAIRAARRGS